MKIKAPIDNKNVLEDFSDVFHNGYFVEQVKGRVRKQLFYLKDFPFELSYVFGNNIFCIQCLVKTERSKLMSELKPIIESLNGGNIHVFYTSCSIDNWFSLTGAFYFNED